MKLPNPEQAFVDLAKLRDYALDPIHEEGKHKARVFASALGISRNEAEWLQGQLLKAAKHCDCSIGRKTDYARDTRLILISHFAAKRRE